MCKTVEMYIVLSRQPIYACCHTKCQNQIDMSKNASKKYLLILSSYVNYKNMKLTLLIAAGQTFFFLLCLRKFSVHTSRCTAHTETIVNFLPNILHHLSLSCCNSPLNVILQVANVLRQWWYVYSVLNVAPEEKVKCCQIWWLRRPSSGASSTNPSSRQVCIQKE
jgi:hypothetical protein